MPAVRRIAGLCAIEQVRGVRAAMWLAATYKTAPTYYPWLLRSNMPGTLALAINTSCPLRKNHLIATRSQTRLSLTLIVVAMALLVSCTTSNSEKGANFRIHAYQSGGILPDTETSLQSVLDLGNPVVLNFWAGDCPPCRAEMPTLEASWRQYGDEVVVLGIDIGPYMGLGTFESGQRLLEQTGITYPAGNAPDPGVISAYNMVGLPMTFFMLPEGTINDSWTGGISHNQLYERIDALIAASKS